MAALRADPAASRAVFPPPGASATSPRFSPAQKCPPAPSSTCTRSPPRSASNSVGGAPTASIIAAPMALRRSGRFSTARTAGPSRRTTKGCSSLVLSPPIQSTVAPVARTMGSHFSISAPMKARVRSGVRPGSASLPSCRSRASTSSPRSAAWICS